MVDPFHYDVSAEAIMPARWSFHRFAEDLLVNLFAPLSYLYILARYGYRELQMSSFVLPAQEESRAKVGYISSDFHDPQKPAHAPSASMVVGIVISNWLFKVMWLVARICDWQHQLREADVSLQQHHNHGYSQAPTNCFILGGVVLFLNLCTAANKKATRSSATSVRMLLHRERRNDELFFGWLPLPWRLSVFELRIAAYRAGKIDLNKERFKFNSCSTEELRAALGEKVLGYIEPVMGPVVFPYKVLVLQLFLPFKPLCPLSRSRDVCSALF
jgi:hypothetical protein